MTHWTSLLAMGISFCVENANQWNVCVLELDDVVVSKIAVNVESSYSTLKNYIFFSILTDRFFILRTMKLSFLKVKEDHSFTHYFDLKNENFFKISFFLGILFGGQCI